jgi:hypothetical protein
MSLVQFPRLENKAWIPTEGLSINEYIYYGELRWDNSIKVQSIPVPTLQFPGQTQLGKALQGQLNAWVSCGSLLDIPHWVGKLISDQPNRNALVGRIISGCESAKSLTTLNKGNFTIKDLVTSANTAVGDERSGIYLNCYRNFPNDPQKTVIRVGKSVNFKKRVADHFSRGKSDSTYGEERTHYTKARQTKEQHYVVLCIVQRPIEQTIAEKLFVNLLETYSPIVLARDLNQFTKGLDNPESDIHVLMSRFAKYRVHSIAAAKQAVLSSEVAKQTNWPGGEN